MLLLQLKKGTGYFFGINSKIPDPLSFKKVPCPLFIIALLLHRRFYHIVGTEAGTLNHLSDSGVHTE